MQSTSRQNSNRILSIFRISSRALAIALILATGVTVTPDLITPHAHAKGYRAAPEGNRSKRQPSIPSASSRRTAASNSSYDAKFKKIVSVLKSDRRLMSSIKRVSKRYGFDPVHMLGAIIGEHTYNYDTLDSAQSYYVKALTYAGIDMSFEHDGEHVDEFVKRPQFERCRTKAVKKGSNSLWSCYETIWNTSFRGKKVDGKKFPRTNFNETFFQPLYAGQSFGLGQLNPLTVLKMTDKVARQSGKSKLTAANAKGVYRATMDPDISLHYMAAIIQDAIQAYKTTAKIDISSNPGLTATLYNLGNPWGRAIRFRRSGAKWPKENYYGWLVNDRLEEIRAILN